MIRVYTRNNGAIVGTVLPKGQTPPPHAVWIDLVHPDEHERLFVSTALGIDLPDRVEMMEIEASSRLYEEGSTTYLTTNILVGFDTPDSALDAILIAVTPETLITMRYCEPRALSLFTERLKNQAAHFSTREEVLVGLLDAILDRVADILEILGKRTDILSRRIFRPASLTTATGKKPDKKEKQLNEILLGVGLTGDMTHKIRDSLNGIARIITFLGSTQTLQWSAGPLARYHALERDAHSLNEHAQFMVNETTFLLDATLGQINIEQNGIIKIFSVVSVVFMPPTLFASIWGMNFHNIPELSLDWGYYMALCVMVVSAILPLAYFKHRGWL